MRVVYHYRLEHRTPLGLEAEDVRKECSTIDEALGFAADDLGGGEGVPVQILLDGRRLHDRRAIERIVYGEDTDHERPDDD